MSDITIMIVGSGAREHVISDMYEKSSQVKKIIVSPGNDFIGYKRNKEVIIDRNSNLKDANSILEIAKKYKPDLVDVAQDDALAAGTVDLLLANGFLAFGPTKNAAKIESDKEWSRGFMERWRIPHPRYRSFNNEERAVKFVEEMYGLNNGNLELYIKATGLCAGKGALKACNLEDAIANIKLMKGFGDAGKTFLIEEAVQGEEFSYYGVGNRFFKSAQDNKTVFDFDEGDQTGGMGAISPTTVTNGNEDFIEDDLMRKVIEGMRKECNKFMGVLYLGGIKQNDGSLKVIEYNARWGDPECQVVLPALKSDYLELVDATISGSLGGKLDLDDVVRVCVVGSSKGYPGDYMAVKGKEIKGLDDAISLPNVKIYGAGIDVINGKFYANGGRLFSVVGEGKDIIEAKQSAYLAMELISIDGNNLHYRIDIGMKDIEKLQGI